MIQDDDIKVLEELSRIVDRHGPDSITRLANLIRNPEFAEEIAITLEKIAKGSPRRRNRSQPRDTNRTGMGILNDLRDLDSQKYAVVAEFRDRLMSGTILKTMPEIRRFTRTNALEIGNATSRKSAIVPLLRSISQLETASITALLDSTVDYRSDDRSLERWRDLIVKPSNSS